MASFAIVLNLNDYCRLCLNNNKPLINAFSAEYANTNLIQDVAALFNIKLSESDGKPTMVCSICMEKIKTWNEKKIEMARNRPVFDFLLKQPLQYIPLPK